LIAALSCGREVAGGRRRTDVDDILELLLSFHADPDQRGINDYTPLHMAVGEGSLTAVRILLDGGANRQLRTRIDDYETALEMAEKAGLDEIAALLRQQPPQGRP
jgi:ankyrin repeat protein